MRGKTCYNNFDRRESSETCDPPLSRVRRYTRIGSLTQVYVYDPHLRDSVSGLPLDVLECDSSTAAVLLVPDKDSEFGLLVYMQTDGARVQPVKIENGRVVTTGDKRPFEDMAFAGELFAVDWDGEPHIVAGEVASLAIRFEDPSRVWKEAVKASSNGRIPRKGTLAQDLVQVAEPFAKAHLLAPALKAVKQLLASSKTLSIDEISERIARRFAASHDLSSQERDQLTDKLKKAAGAGG